MAVDATPLLDVRTGVGTFVAEVLARLGSRPELDVVAYGLTRIYLDELRSRLPAGLTSTARPIPRRTMLELWRRFDFPVIERWTGALNVVHGTNFVVPPARGAVELVSVHDLTAVRFPEMCDSETVHYPTFIRRAVSRGAHVHTVSHFVADEVVQAFDVAPDRVHTVHNGVATLAGGNAARGRALSGRDRYVLAIGTIEPRKNLALLVEAFDVVAADDSDIGLVVAGRRGWHMEAFESALGAARSRDRIVLLGFVPDDQRADLVAGASVLAYPSTYEGFGLPPLEAMSAGLPVVATSAGALPEVLGDAAVLVPADRDELAAALGRVVGDEALRTELVGRGRARAARYSWDRCADEMAALYLALTTSS
ncbi:glycosyltransferase family 1 protein [soil metagenome]